MSPFDSLRRTIQHIRAARRLQNELLDSLKREKEPKEREKIARRLFFAGEQVLRGTCQVKKALHEEEVRLFGK